MESTSLFLGKGITVQPGLEGKGEPLVVRIITAVIWPGRYPLQGIKNTLVFLFRGRRRTRIQRTPFLLLFNVRI